MAGNNDRDERPSPFIQMMLVMVLDIVFGLLAMPIVAWFSRFREYRADKGGADLAGKEKMIAALEALTRAYPQLESATEQTDSNFRSMQISSKEGFMQLFSTHPPLAERIAVLRKN